MTKLIALIVATVMATVTLSPSLAQAGDRKAGFGFFIQEGGKTFGLTIPLRDGDKHKKKNRRKPSKKVYKPATPPGQLVQVKKCQEYGVSWYQGQYRWRCIRWSSAETIQVPNHHRRW